MKRNIQINTTFLEKYWHWILIVILSGCLFLLFQYTTKLESKIIENERKAYSLQIELKNKETLQTAIKRQDSILLIQSDNEKKSLELLRKQKYEKTVIYITDDDLPSAFAERFNKGKQK